MSARASLYRVTIDTRTTREDYISKCRTQGTVSIRNEGGIMHDIEFPKGQFPYIVFPTDGLNEGSKVAVMKLPGSSEAYITAIYGIEDRSDVQPKEGFLFDKQLAASGAVVEVDGKGSATLESSGTRNAKTAVRALGADSQLELESTDRASLEATNDVRVESTVNVTVEGDTSVLTLNGENAEVRFEDKKVLLNKDSITIEFEGCNSVVLNKEKIAISHDKLLSLVGEDQPAVLGEELRMFLFDLVDGLLQWFGSIPTPAGPVPHPAALAQLPTMLAKVTPPAMASPLLSKKVKLK